MVDVNSEFGTTEYSDTSSDVESLNWRKARRSMNHGACVEVGTAVDNVVVRDTTDHEGTHIAYTPAAWRDFLGKMAAGEVITQLPSTEVAQIQSLPRVDLYDTYETSVLLAA